MIDFLLLKVFLQKLLLYILKLKLFENMKDLVFEVCHEKLTEIKSIKIFKSGVIDRIQNKPLIGECK